MSECFEKADYTSDSAPQQLSAAQLYPDLKDIACYLQASSDLGTALPGLDLVNNQFRPLSKGEQVAREADNAKRQWSSLMELSGSTADGLHGLSRSHLEKLSTMRLNPAQYDAFLFFHKNYEALCTRRFGGTGWENLEPTDSAITLSSINRYMHKAEPVGRTAPTGGSGEVRS